MKLRAFVASIFGATLLVSLAWQTNLMAQQSDGPNNTPLYPDTYAKDYLFDAPWRVKSESTRIPFILEIKDADINDLEELKKWELFYRDPSGQLVLFFTHDFGSVTITAERFTRFTSVTPAQLGFGQGDTVEILCDMTYRDDWSFTKHFKKTLRVIVGTHLPNIAGKWYYGDTHYHSYFTDNRYEYGGDMGMTRSSAIAMGLDWVTTTDHASNDSRFPVSSAGVLVSDLGYDDWPHLQDSATAYSDGSFRLIVGEEVTCNNDGSISDKGSIHCLIYNPTEYVSGPVGILTEGSSNTIRSLTDVLAETESYGGFSYASHPTSEFDPVFYLDLSRWSSENLDSALTFESFAGLEAWNTRTKWKKNIDYDDQNPFPWSEESGAIGVSHDPSMGIRLWDSLTLSQLPTILSPDSLPRKVFLSGGSDAHGDFNYTTQGLGDVIATDNAFGKVRTAVFCETGMGIGGVNVIRGLREGRSVVTDGPLVTLAVDMNMDDVIGSGDLRIGDHGTLDRRIQSQLMVEWLSTSDFGPVRRVKLLVGYPASDTGAVLTRVDTIPNSGSGVYKLPLADVLSGIPAGWCFIRAEGYTQDREYRCYTNPIWLYIPLNTDVVEDEVSPELPKTFSLSQNYPNPFNPETTIRFSLPKASTVTLEIYNILGQRVVTLVNGFLPAGYKSVSWDGTDQNGVQVSSGTYLYKLTTDEYFESRKMVLVK